MCRASSIFFVYFLNKTPDLESHWCLFYELFFGGFKRLALKQTNGIEKFRSKMFASRFSEIFNGIFLAFKSMKQNDTDTVHEFQKKENNWFLNSFFSLLNLCDKFYTTNSFKNGVHLHHDSILTKFWYISFSIVQNVVPIWMAPISMVYSDFSRKIIFIFCA